ncbi:MAG: isoprenylcysteine carboxylmethyltransferase family protein [Pseudomonadota bacterium]|nr:isoprenylcysteine carboxylmethyltransferase family protein [Pseudomonadota bacterium]
MFQASIEPWLLLAFFAVYFLIAFVWRSVWVWRETGINPYNSAGPDNTHRFSMRAFRILLVVLTLWLLASALFPELQAFAGPMEWLEDPVLTIMGWIMLGVALLWTALAEIHMGRSWRIGIDTGRAANLVTDGLFALSRNPVFLGMRLGLCGLFLVQPNALTLAIAVAGDILIQIQVRLEEAHLLKIHEEKYAEYRHSVRRWL